MRHLGPAALVLLSLLAGGTPLAAQSGTVQPGTTVRATMATGVGEVLVGTLLSRTADSLTIVTRGNDAIVRIPSTSIRSIEVVNGKRRVAPGLKWALIGGGVWAAITSALPFENCATNKTSFCYDSRAQFVAEQAVAMAAVAGGFAAYRGEDHWVRIEGSAPTAFIAPSSRGGVSIGLRFSR